MGLGNCPPIYPTAVEVIPLVLLSKSSTCQKHPAPNVAFNSINISQYQIKRIWLNFKNYLTSVKISTTFLAKFSMFALGSAEINNRICVTGKGKLTKTALSRLAAR